MTKQRKSIIKKFEEDGEEQEQKRCRQTVDKQAHD